MAPTAHGTSNTVVTYSECEMSDGGNLRPDSPQLPGRAHDASPDRRRVLVPSDLGRRLEPVHAPLGDHGSLRLAAVIALITPAERLVLIERSSRLRSHAGQIAFPGGKPEAHDRDLVDTALREAEEEVALDRSVVRVIGRLEPVPTPTGFYIVPFVGRVESDWSPRVASGEVERVLEPEVAELADPNIHRITATRKWQGKAYELHEFAISDPPLWGATARMTWELLERMGHV